MLRRGVGPGITPACAGSSRWSSSSRRHGPDHPRVCGEQGQVVKRMKLLDGSPPRVRGAGGRRGPGAATGGITPACAGSRSCRRWVGVRGWDHPRVCGEQDEIA